MGALPAAARLDRLSRTEQDGRVVEEHVASFDHEGRPVEVACVISTDGDERRVYLDDASVLVQAGRLDPAGLPVAGAEQTAKARDPRGHPSNGLIGRWPESAGTVAPPPGQGADEPGGDVAAMLDAHLADEFVLHDARATMGTMIADPYLNHVPVMTGGVGWDEVFRFYEHHFIPIWPDDLVVEPVARTVAAADRVVDELLMSWTHGREMDAILPGVAPTGRAITASFAVVVGFDGGRVAYEHIYWDHADMLRQIGVLGNDDSRPSRTASA